MFLLLGASISL